MHGLCQVTFDSLENAEAALHREHGNIYAGKDYKGSIVTPTIKMGKINEKVPSSLGALPVITHAHISATLESLGKYSVTISTPKGSGAHSSSSSSRYCSNLLILLGAVSTGRIFSVNVQRTMTVEQLKRLVCHPEYTYGYHPDRTQLILASTRTNMSDEKTLGACNVLPGSTIFLSASFTEGMKKRFHKYIMCSGRGVDEISPRQHLTNYNDDGEVGMESELLSSERAPVASGGGNASVSCLRGKKHRYLGVVIHPDGALRIHWDMLIGFGVILSVWLVPFTVAFQEEINLLDGAFTNAINPIERMLDILFLLHVIVELRCVQLTALRTSSISVAAVSMHEPWCSHDCSTAYIDPEEKNLVVDAKSIAIRYMVRVDPAHRSN